MYAKFLALVAYTSEQAKAAAPSACLKPGTVFSGVLQTPAMWIANNLYGAMLWIGIPLVVGYLIWLVVAIRSQKAGGLMKAVIAIVGIIIMAPVLVAIMIKAGAFSSTLTC